MGVYMLRAPGQMLSARSVPLFRLEMLRSSIRVLGALPVRARMLSSIVSTESIVVDNNVPAPPPPPVPNHRSILALDGDEIRPFIQPNAFVAPSASVIGSVVVNDKAAVMYGAVVRGDLGLIHIGAFSIIGENATLTAGSIAGELSASDAVQTGLSMKIDLLVGDYTHIGANTSLASCTLKGRNYIGAGSTISPGAKIGFGSILEPNTMVPPDTEIPPGELWGGKPARKIRSVSQDEISALEKFATASYVTTCDHAYEFLPVGYGYLEKEKLSPPNLSESEAKL
jgi:gamma-carbonic anhydrase